MIDIRVLVALNLIFGGYLYFAFDAIFMLDGRLNEYLPFPLYLGLSSALVYAMLLVDTISSLKLPKNLILFFIFLTVAALTFVLSDKTEFDVKQFQLLLLYGPTGFYIGIILCKKIDGKKLRPYLYLIIVVGALSTLLSLESMFNKSVVDLMDFYGGGQYQSYSHFAAICFLMCLMIVIEQEELSFYKAVVIYGSAIVLLAGVTLSGGRGGAVLGIGGAMYILFRYKKQNTTMVKSMVMMLVITLLFIAVGNDDLLTAEEIDRLKQGYDRITSFIGAGGIEIDGISNRETFYSNAIALIIEKPVFGYGVFGLSSYYDEFYPHNIILEIILHGGLVYLIFALVLFAVLARVFLRIDKNANSFEIIVPAVLYSIFILMVSSSYLIEPIFWLVFGYLTSLSSKDRS